MVPSIPKMEPELHLFVTAFWFVILFPRFLNFGTFSKELTSSMILSRILLSRHELKCTLPIVCHRLLQLPESGQCQDRLLENCTSGGPIRESNLVSGRVQSDWVSSHLKSKCIYECYYVGILCSWQFLDAIEFTTLTPVSLPDSYKLSFAVFSPNMPIYSASTSALESSTDFFV
jgi:hypothetical protein